MTFLAMIIALVLERLSPLEDWLHRDGWFRSWQSQLAALGLSGTAHTVVSVLLPCLLAQWLMGHLQAFLFGMAWIAAAVLLLLYAVGRGNLSADQERYRSQCRREDLEAVLRDAGSGFDWDEEEGSPEPGRIHQVVQAGFLYNGYQRWFAVLFYFLLLGPVGALAYRLLQLSCEQPAQQRGLLFYCDWVPVRLLASTFALAGNFVASADELWTAWRSASLGQGQVLYRVAIAAAGEQPFDVGTGVSGQQAAVCNEGLSALMQRAAVCWVVVVSVFVILL